MAGEIPAVKLLERINVILKARGDKPITWDEWTK